MSLPAMVRLMPIAAARTSARALSNCRPSMAPLAVEDYFAPFNADLLSQDDLDLGSSGALLLPDAVGDRAHPHLLVSGSKEGRIYVLDRDNMGHFQPGSDSQIVQSLPSAVGAGIPDTGLL